MEKHQLIFFLLLLLQTTESFIFRTTSDEENTTELNKPIMEARVFDTEQQGGWFGLFSRKKDESNEDVIENISNLPVLSNEWVNKYKEMISELSKMNTLLKDVSLSKNLLNKYNSSMQHLIDIQNRLEDAIDSEVMEKYNFTVDSINQGKEIFLSYNWFEKYSEALDTLNEIKTSVDNSFNYELNKVTSGLSGLKSSWERFSFYKFWQEQYKDMANINFAWNNTWIENDWFGTNNTNGEFLANLKSAFPKVASYQDLVKQYLPSMEKTEPVCTSKVLTCPDNK